MLDNRMDTYSKRFAYPAGHNGSSLPVTRLVDSYYAEVQELGGNRWDTSSLLARLKV